MAAVIRLAQTPNWAKRRNLPPVRQRNQTSRTREYLMPDEVERLILATRKVGGLIKIHNYLCLPRIQIRRMN